MEFPDWAYYLANVALLVSQLAIWTGNLCRLPANWILVANSALYASFFTGKLNGLGFGYGLVLFFMTLAVLGESLAYAARHRRNLAEQNRLAGLENTLLGAGTGSLIGAVSLFWIPLIGPFLSLVGAVTGAAGGAYVGTLYSRSQFDPPSETAPNAAPAPTTDSRLTNALELAARGITGALIVLLSSYSSFSG